MPTPPDPSVPRVPGEPPPDGARPLPGLVAFAGMGLTMAVCVALGVGAGIAVDHWLHSAPVFLLVGLALGVALAAGLVVAQVKRYL